MTDVLKMLADFCEPENKRLAAPFSADIDGRKWACGTNGHMLVAVPYENDLRRDGPDLNAVIPPGVPTHEAPLSAMREWAGEAVKEKCEPCEGDGWVVCGCPDCMKGAHPCEECDGKGSFLAPRAGHLLHGVINRDYLRRVLEAAPEGVQAIRFQQAEPMTPYMFRAAEWLALVMPRLPDSAPSDAPRFLADEYEIRAPIAAPAAAARESHPEGK